MAGIDLHCHTTASDGTLTPPELVARAAADGVDVIAVTDHDTTEGVAGARASSGAVQVIAGIELSSRHAGRSVHMLGYFLDPASAPLNERLDELKADRLRRARGIVERLNELGYELTYDEVLEQAGGEIVARPHIARAMVARGYIDRVRDAFTPELIVDGGRADVPKNALEAVDAVSLIRRAGGVPVIAHCAVGHHDGPERTVPTALIELLAEAGLGGVEVDHPDHPEHVRAQLRPFVAGLGLVATGGSDFHGDPGQTVGWCRTDPDALAELERRAG